MLSKYFYISFIVNKGNLNLYSSGTFRAVLFSPDIERYISKIAGHHKCMKADVTIIACIPCRKDFIK